MAKPANLKTALAAVMALSLGACTTQRDSQPARTATEQLEISAAVDRAVEQIDLKIPAGTKIFVDTADFDAIDGKYAIGAIKDRLLKNGARLMEKRDAAEMVVEIRSGALSIDQHKFLIGIPSFDLPVPLSTAPLSFPEIAFYKREDNQGVAKFALTAYDAKDGIWRDSAGPRFGYSHNINRVVMFLYSWTKDDLIPPADKDKE
jgi:hypothetical protein